MEDNGCKNRNGNLLSWRDLGNEKVETLADNRDFPIEIGITWNIW